MSHAVVLWRHGAILLSILAALICGQTPLSPFYRDRFEFSEKVTALTDNSKAQVRATIGPPDQVVLHDKTQENPSYGVKWDEAWLYGTDGPGTMPTLGIVIFEGDRVFWGHYPTPDLVAPVSLPEPQLRAAIRSFNRIRAGDGGRSLSDPLGTIRAANLLIRLGKQDGLSILQQAMAIDWHHGDELSFAVRAVAEPDSSHPELPPPIRQFRNLNLNSRGEVVPDNHPFPRNPLTMIADIPILAPANIGFTSGGPDHHVLTEEYKPYSFRTKKLRPPDDPFQAFFDYMKTDEWAHFSTRFGAHEVAEQLVDLVRTVKKFKYRNYYNGPEDYGFLPAIQKEFLKLGGHWDENLECYVRRDGTFDEPSETQVYDATFWDWPMLGSSIRVVFQQKNADLARVSVIYNDVDLVERTSLSIADASGKELHVFTFRHLNLQSGEINEKYHESEYLEGSGHDIKIAFDVPVVGKSPISFTLRRTSKSFSRLVTPTDGHPGPEWTFDY